MENINICIISKGDIEKVLISVNYAQALKKCYGKEAFHLIIIMRVEKQIYDSSLFNFLKKGLNGIIDGWNDHYIFDKNSKAVPYDVVIEVDIFPEILYVGRKVSEDSILNVYFEKLYKFQTDTATGKYYDKYPEQIFNKCLYSIMNHKNCISCVDIFNELQMSDEYIINLENVMNQISCESEQSDFIAFAVDARIFDTSKNDTDCWEKVRYGELMVKFKECFPKIRIVQLTTCHQSRIDYADFWIDVQEDVNSFLGILKNAKLLLSGDGAMVHLRKLLGGGNSIVLFGSRPGIFFGLKGDIVIQEKGCRHWCAGLTDTWRVKCLIGDHPKCMEMITADRILKKIEEEIKE